jgi:hypothetical protein
VTTAGAADTDDANTDDDDNASSDGDPSGGGSSDTDSDPSGGSGNDPTTDGAPSAVPQFDGTSVVVANAQDGLDIPQDLAFSPDAPDQLWVVNAAFHGVVILFDPGGDPQTAETRIDLYAQHFMANVSSLAFGSSGSFSSCQESRDEWNGVPQPPDDFMGPTLWSSDLDIFAVVGQEYPPNGVEGSHLDMLHQSPLCMGIAHDSGNAYWAFDGLHGHIVYYDFMSDHGPGGGDHSDGAVRRYPEATVTRIPEAPGHLVLDHSTGWLYVADTGSGNVMRLDTQTGSYSEALSGNVDGIPEYSAYRGVTWEAFATGLQQPSGLALADGILFVGDRTSGDVIAYDVQDGGELDRFATGATAVAGLEIGPQGRLWYTDARDNEVVVIR